jgi:two-component system response regulator YesN
MYRMMIVDDEKWQREGLCEFLDWSSLGVALSGAAANGAQGVELAKAVRPHIVLTDIVMPLMNGLDMSREIRRLLPDVRIILLSGHDDFQYAKEAFSFAASEYLLKPVLREELEQAIRRIVDALDDEDHNRVAASLPRQEVRTPSERRDMPDPGAGETGDAPAPDPVVARIRELVARQYANPLDLGAVSKVVNLSPYYVGELFRRHEGVGFHQYLAEYRLEQARQQIVATNHPVSDIAIRVGMKNRSYFCKLFRERYGVSPVEYRTVMRGKMLLGQVDCR